MFAIPSATAQGSLLESLLKSVLEYTQPSSKNVMQSISQSTRSGGESSAHAIQEELEMFFAADGIGCVV